jgi:hypothetical protein
MVCKAHCFIAKQKFGFTGDAKRCPGSFRTGRGIRRKHAVCMRRQTAGANATLTIESNTRVSAGT